MLGAYVTEAKLTLSADIQVQHILFIIFGWLVYINKPPFSKRKLLAVTSCVNNE